MNLRSHNANEGASPLQAMGGPAAAIVLAAGASTRLGQPKALVEVGGTPLIVLAHEHLSRAGCSPIVIVTRQELAVDLMLALPEATVAINTDPERGRTGSLQRGLMALMSELGRLPRQVVMAPVDRPGWSPSVVLDLLKHGGPAGAKDGASRGHPVVFDTASMQAVLASHPETPLRDIVSFFPVDVHAPYLHLNIDTQEDVLLLKEHEPALLAYFLQ
ncbi:MAG: NTP transferase domain-containing protein [Candidatus Poseidonia sp.]|nr:NTP transferase domain-containing protein [Poseidonia sp.]MBL6892400.1 NTP transferase domain-containing protein [Poseidonia sp.]